MTWQIHCSQVSQGGGWQCWGTQGKATWDHLLVRKQKREEEEGIGSPQSPPNAMPAITWRLLSRPYSERFCHLPRVPPQGPRFSCTGLWETFNNQTIVTPVKTGREGRNGWKESHIAGQFCESPEQTDGESPNHSYLSEESHGWEMTSSTSLYSEID